MKVNKAKNPEKFICPRCGGLIPSNEEWGKYVGALSRHTRSRGVPPVEVCSACGTEEAIEQHLGELTAIDEYPIINDATIARRFGAIAIMEQRREFLDPPAVND